jgi:hypothetical protein
MRTDEQSFAIWHTHAGNPSGVAMARTNERTNATDERHGHLTNTSLVTDRTRSEITAEDVRRIARVLAAQGEWWEVVSAVAAWWRFPSMTEAHAWYSTVPRPLTGYARELWVAEQRVAAGEPIIPEARQLEIAIAALEASEQRLAGRSENEHAVLVAHTNGSPDWEIAEVTGLSERTVIRVRHRLGLPPVSRGGARVALGQSRKGKVA